MLGAVPAAAVFTTRHRTVALVAVAGLAFWGAWINTALASWLGQIDRPGYTALRYQLDDAIFGGRLLHEAGYMSVEMRENWIRMIGFRNVLVHDYLDVDRGLVYEVMQQRLGDFEALRRVFAEML